MTDKEFIEFKELLKKGLNESFNSVVKANKIYGFGLCTSEFTDSIICVVNTLEHFDSQKIKYKDKKASLGCKFLVAEWDYSINTGNSYFDKLNEMLFNEIFVEKSKEEHLLFEHKIYDICIESLKELKNEACFVQNSEDEIFLTFDSGDNSFNIKELINNIQYLNNNNYVDEYIYWLNI